MYNFIKQLREFNFYNKNHTIMAKQSIFQETYTRNIGSFKPRFEGKPADYWEISTSDGVTACLLLMLTIGVFVALSIGCMVWIIQTTSSEFALVWGIICAIFTLIFLYFSYTCSKSKKSIEDKLIKQSIAATQKTNWNAKKADKNPYGQTSLMNLNQ